MPVFRRLRLLWICLLLVVPAWACAEELPQVMVDFGLVQQLNEDCVGWLYEPHSGLNQPVMQHETDEWYRERAFDQTKVYKMGSVYLHAQDRLNDPVIVLRGQAREEGCLSAIPEWREQAIFDQRSTFMLLTPQGDYQAQAFACLAVEKGGLEAWLPEGSFAAWLQKVQESSLVQCDPSALPAEGDRLLFIAGEQSNRSITLITARLIPAEQTGGKKTDLNKKALDQAQTQNGMVDAGPAGQLMYYAQNDPLYDRMRYESAVRNDVRRDFGGGGCGPTAMAIIAANLVDSEDLPKLKDYALNELGTLMCSCSVNRVYCDHSHVPYQLQTPEEYLRYLPVAMGDFAAGNNRWEFLARRVNAQGTNVRFVDYVCEAYGLAFSSVNGLDAALEIMKDKTGEGLILATALWGSPYTNNSHFVVITGVDEEYFYVLDPLCRTEEDYLVTDTRGILELLSPGVTRIRLSDYGRSDLSPVYYISRSDS